MKNKSYIYNVFLKRKSGTTAEWLHVQEDFVIGHGQGVYRTGESKPSDDHWTYGLKIDEVLNVFKNACPNTEATVEKTEFKMPSFNSFSSERMRSSMIKSIN